MNKQQEMTSYLRYLIAGLKQGGVRQVVISPGSRSTPLALLVKREVDLQYFVAVDERSAGFLALGLAKSSQQPVALLCTSGTAAANFYPAICEAEASNVPLVVLTSDRPPELRNVGAPQTMSQNQLYADHVKFFVELALPESTPLMLRYSFWQGFQLATRAMSGVKGVVHANIPLREPLLPDLTQITPIDLSLTQTTTQNLIAQGWFQKKGLIVLGSERSLAEAQLALTLANHLGWPIVGDPLSQLASCDGETQNYVKQADVIFEETRDLPEVEVILRFGKVPVTKNVMFYLRDSQAVQILVDETQQWPDYLYRSQYLIAESLTEVAQQLLQSTPKRDQVYLQAWQNLQKLASQAIDETSEQFTFHESQLAMILMKTLARGEQLFVANSNAIRLVDRLSGVSETSFQVFGNRGVNGIDGILSTVAGLAMQTKARTYLLVGDLTLFHDMNGLQLLKSYQLPVTIILLNNNAGGIFSFLSQRSLTADDFDPLFATPLDLDFAQVAKTYELAYQKVESEADFEQAIATSRKLTGANMIELTSQAQVPVDFWQAVLSNFKEKRMKGCQL
ncbi:2-succinyl-5-enolpyruvyl-6-hydroxy-3-cyclohexene-1-carboxylic-acid synthase [Enterococcus cecorum]|uniref:2-succinyl-5-enolpyruvyl-6-hydroxy-3- cyclohexene-1-carboxylic-acid synthase n=1 Tax=Enterococcus cecorum TaxID=44008 RepID=UPI000DEB6593|nr:2-succinyl-5-enolpyruvyl-6-hydroxy-3-cyclohexene-1-carboxylic-acid synthase [Enterococcus cecorum]RBR28476.1 2-succinyl-5-enolpyruvyl-6-hydroxy-3-cyclohexene-1-carboxylic-acid synthase [Enterococcus cecorum]RBR35080.1 2-succinyl-5-enolpyruvyl-6-hydroxy-3-cyclohexene-1-carboxylic-acid synthase [Enterococcus cecorum]RBR35248.1 2-succinyl-5-enolpyruvyl-6-hydroxy-3-cyclohexene-1-carboxylic-acid synthase [Enterococcus cecorum]RBR35684.1 2-succinyl-5-enolpyruvyl-6-hydroxy-3-cyclohexene-1-carboxyli